VAPNASIKGASYYSRAKRIDKGDFFHEHLLLQHPLVRVFTVNEIYLARKSRVSILESHARPSLHPVH
jgi:hypothetical protein